MSEWAPKRFWQNATVETEGEGFAVRLDGRPVKTPGKAPLLMPTRAIAENVAAEWQAQDDRIDPRTMPWTRSANSAIDKVAPERIGVRDHLISYAGTDLLCYRAERPESLVERQSKEWDPILDWTEKTFGVRLLVTKGVMPISQNEGSLVSLYREMEAMTDYQITGFYDLVTLSGSYAIGLAAAHGFQTPETLWAASRIDEVWQAEQWGQDDEAEEMARIKESAFLHAASFYHAA